MRSINDLVEKIKGLNHFEAPNLRTIPDDLFLGLIIILVAFGSFGLGRLSKIKSSKTPVTIEGATPVGTAPTTAEPSQNNQGASVIGTVTDDSQLVGSKNGTKYYYPWCSGVKNISQANLIHFTSKSEAETRGYTPSSTCKGL